MSNPIDPATNPDRACRDQDTEMFFPAPADIVEARQVINTFCKQCPVMPECLEWALHVEGAAGHSGRAGIFGGTTARQRAEIARTRRKGGPEESKVCEGCGQLFFRREDERLRQWKERRFHTQSCANRVSEAKRRAARDVA